MSTNSPGVPALPTPVHYAITREPRSSTLPWRLDVVAGADRSTSWHPSERDARRDVKAQYPRAKLVPAVWFMEPHIADAHRRGAQSGSHDAIVGKDSDWHRALCAAMPSVAQSQTRGDEAQAFTRAYHEAYAAERNAALKAVQP